MKKVLGLGNALVDLIIEIDDEKLLESFLLPKGSMTLVDKEKAALILEETKDLKMQIAAGGSASNTIDGLASLGVDCGYIGKIGNDPYGELFKKELISNHINPALLTGENPTGTAITLLTKDAERTFATYLGAAIEMIPGDLKEDHFREYGYLHLEGYLVQNNELILRAVRMAKTLGLRVSMDMASYNVVAANKDFLQNMMRDYVDIVFANEDEARTMTEMEPEEAVHELAKHCEIAVVKMGKYGSIIKRGDEVVQVDGIEAVLRDTTGAGDLYASGFLFGLNGGLDLATCGKIGSLLGGKVIEIYGARMDEERWDMIKETINAEDF